MCILHLTDVAFTEGFTHSGALPPLMQFPMTLNEMITTMIVMWKAMRHLRDRDKDPSEFDVFIQKAQAGRRGSANQQQFQSRL